MEERWGDSADTVEKLEVLFPTKSGPATRKFNPADHGGTRSAPLDVEKEFDPAEWGAIPVFDPETFANNAFDPKGYLEASRWRRELSVISETAKSEINREIARARVLRSFDKNYGLFGDAWVSDTDWRNRYTDAAKALVVYAKGRQLLVVGSQSILYFTAMGCLTFVGILVATWIWYFLLARVTEFSIAVRRRPKS